MMLQACSVFRKTADTYHTTTRDREYTGGLIRKEFKALRFWGKKKKEKTEEGYWMHIGERKALDFIHLLIKQKCFPIRWKETEREITITYHYRSPVVELTSPIEVVK